MPAIPSEIITKVLSAATEPDTPLSRRPTILATAALADKQFFLCAQRLLYRHLSIALDTSISTLHGHRRIPLLPPHVLQLCHSLQANSSLPPLVRSLSVDATHKPILPVAPGFVTVLVSLIPNLRRLEIIGRPGVEWEEWSGRFLQAIHDSSLTLVELVLLDINIPFVDGLKPLLLALPSLRVFVCRVDLINLATGPPTVVGAQPFHPPRTNHLNLEHLDLSLMEWTQPSLPLSIWSSLSALLTQAGGGVKLLGLDLGMMMQLSLTANSGWGIFPQLRVLQINLPARTGSQADPVMARVTVEQELTRLPPAVPHLRMVIPVVGRAIPLPRHFTHHSFLHLLPPHITDLSGTEWLQLADNYLVTVAQRRQSRGFPTLTLDISPRYPDHLVRPALPGSPASRRPAHAMAALAAQVLPTLVLRWGTG